MRIGYPINRIIHPGRPPHDPLKLIILMICDPLWVNQALGNRLTSIVSHSHLWKQYGARDMTIFGSRVGPHIPNIEYLDVYGGIWGYVGVYGCIWGYMRGYTGIWGYVGAPGAGAPAAGELMRSELYHQGGMRIGPYM